MTEKRKSGRPQAGQLIWKDNLGWYGRYYADVEGERVRVCRALHTENKAIAKRKLVRLIAAGNVSAEEAQRPETFEEAARRVIDEAKAAGMSTWKDRLYRLEAYAFPTLAKMVPASIRAAHVRSLLDAARDLGKSRQTLVHLKNDVSVVLGELWRAELLPENVCARVQIPEALPAASERTKKERAVLEDDELVRYLGWQHPDERHQMAVLERQVMSCVSRCFGGLRGSDLHAVGWQGFDLPDFAWGYAPRRKGRRLAHGGKPQQLQVPEPLRPLLRDWWERQGRPTTGLVFPKRRGADAGEGGRKKSSHAHAFRRDLRRVFGLEAWDAGSESWKPTGRSMTSRERTLLLESEYTLPVDFHSWRRAYNQALADAGVNAQQAKALAGHSTTAAHDRYLRNTERMRTIPTEALPRIGVVGHTAVGTLTEAVPSVANDGESSGEKTREYLPAAVGMRLWVPAVGGSNPLTPTKD
jgi:hypothetical protein